MSPTGPITTQPPSHLTTQTVERAGIRGTATVAPAPVALVGDVRLTLEIDGEAPLAVEKVAFAAPPGWRLRGTEAPTLDEPAGGRQHWRQAFRLTPDRPGELPLPPPVVRVRAGGHETPVAIEWPAFAVPVTTSLPRVDLDEAHGITGPEPAPSEPPSQLRNWLIVAAAIAGLAVIFAIVWRRGRRPQLAPEPPPDERALAALAGLHGRAPDDPTAADDLADVLRGYLSRRYHLDTSGKTTAEVLVLLRQSPLPPEATGRWSALLERGDLARFARLDFTAVEWAASLGRMRELVTATIPIGEFTETAQTGGMGEKA